MKKPSVAMQRKPGFEAIPPTNHVGTLIYLTEDGSWPETPHTIIPDRAPWDMTQGDVFELEDLTPGNMGDTITVKCIEDRKVVQIKRRSGAYKHQGQCKLFVLVKEIVNTNHMSKLTRKELERAQ